MGQPMPFKLKRLVVLGEQNSGKTTWASLFYGKKRGNDNSHSLAIKAIHTHTHAHAHTHTHTKKNCTLKRKDEHTLK